MFKDRTQKSNETNEKIDKKKNDYFKKHLLMVIWKKKIVPDYWTGCMIFGIF